MSTLFGLRDLSSAGVSVLDCEHKTPAACSDGFPYIAIPDIQDGRVAIETTRRISAADLEEWTRRTIPQPGDVIVTRRGRVGDTAPIPAGIRCAIGQNLVLLRSDGRQLLQAFLRWAVRSPQWWSEVDRLMNVGAVFSSLNVRDIAKIRVPVPPLPQQRAIAEVLGAVDDKIAANTKLAESIAELAALEFSCAHLNANRVDHLSELVSTQYGVTTSAHGLPGPKFLRVTDINKKPWIEWDSTPNCTVSDVELDKYRVSPGDILVARMADPGKAAFIDQGDPESVFASYLVRLKPHDPSHALYLYYFLKSPHYLEYAEGAMTGSVQKNMNAKVIVATDVALPDSDRIMQFNATVGALRKLIQSYLKENMMLAATRDALLPQLMSGKLRVKEAEKFLENAWV